MIVGVLKEAADGESRVAATPVTVAQLISLGYSVVIESNAGVTADFSDDAYVSAGAQIGPAAGADIVFGVNAPSVEQLDQMRDGSTLVSLLSPSLNSDLLVDLARRNITALAMDAVPRISRAQSLDVLSSMANIAGYRAVIESANVFGRFFTGQITAAGKVPPAKVLVAGVGVAGLAAIGTAGGMGAVVYATDPRPEVADQVASLGGQYLEVASAEVEVSTTGYAKEMSDDYNERAAALYSQWVPDIDILITTALIPGRQAPVLITSAMVSTMKRGSVIVDMAASNGGNVEGTVKDEIVVTSNGVTIIGYTDLAGRLASQASQLFGTNLVNLMKLMTPAKDGVASLDWDDVVQRGITVTRDGAVTWPPPAVQVSAAPTQAPVAPVMQTPVKLPMSAQRRYAIIGVGAALLLALVAAAPVSLRVHLTVFALAIVIGYYVIGSVHHALHTQLMSVTNAISGIIVVGALLQIGHGDAVISTLAFIAILLASINVFGGFAVTRRMLSMFSRS